MKWPNPVCVWHVTRGVAVDFWHFHGRSSLLHTIPNPITLNVVCMCDLTPLTLTLTHTHLHPLHEKVKQRPCRTSGMGKAEQAEAGPCGNARDSLQHRVIADFSHSLAGKGRWGAPVVGSATPELAAQSARTPS